MQPIPNTDFFTYTVQFLALAGTAASEQTLNFDSSSDFIWMYSTYDADVGAAAQTSATRVYPLANLLITPSDTSAKLMNAAVPMTAIFGVAENPFILPAPRLIPAKSALTFAITNRTAGTTYNLYLNLVGYKKYKR